MLKSFKTIGITLIFYLTSLSLYNLEVSKNKYVLSPSYKSLNQSLINEGSNEQLFEGISIKKPNKVDRAKVKIEKKLKGLENIVDENIMDFISKVHNSPKEVKINYKGFIIIASSNIAEGLANYYEKHKKHREEIIKALENIIQTIASPNFNPYKTNLFKVENYKDYGLFLSHVNIILGSYERVAHNGKYRILNEKISKYLAKRILSDKYNHMPSFPHSSLRWPADQAALLYSLYLYDANFGKDISKKPIRKWLDYMKKHGIDKRTGLHVSEVTGRAKYSPIPRGCALSWTIKYMVKFAPKEAKKLWSRYKKEFLVDYILFAGLREYPKGYDLNPDIDSGPIFNGIGTSATVFGIGAANAIGDHLTYCKLFNLYKMGKLIISIVGDNKTKRLSNDLLASSIIFSSKYQ